MSAPTSAPSPLLVTEALAGQRLDALLHAQQPELSRHAARRVCELGAIAIGGVTAAPTDRVRLDDLVTTWPQTQELSLALGMLVVFADDDVLVLCKPQGLAVHGGPLVDDSVAARLERAFPGAGAGLGQRLDRGSSGLLLIGRNAEALRALGAAMETGRIERDYLAIAGGVLADDARTVTLPLRTTDEPRGDQPKVLVDETAGQPAVTHLTTLDRRADCTLLRCRLETGRTHQIRAHLRAIGHPLLGDPRYGDAAANTKAKSTFGIDRPMLHATRLSFPHPRSDAQTEVQAPHPVDFARVFRSLRARRSNPPPA
ncbi:MAG: RluA family pseudouridine synthase [Planctomycetes bacterium]|nr:RluA family pseudouridine synthase [Planctomycetota bacterium]